MEKDYNLFLYSCEKIQEPSLPILKFLKINKFKNLHLFKDVSKELQIDVIGFKQIDKKFTLYEVRITRGSVYWIFQTRYSLLKSLNEKLQKNGKIKNVQFPNSKFYGNLDQEFVLRRAKQLNIYLKFLINNCLEEKIVQNFLIESQKAAIKIYDPDQIDYFQLDA